jgi:hypothetical protein
MIRASCSEAASIAMAAVAGRRDGPPSWSARGEEPPGSRWRRRAARMTERMTTPDLARVLADQAESLARALFPAGRQQGHHWCVGSLASEPGQSLRISLAGKHRGRWRDFADGSGGDLLDLVAAVRFAGDLRQAIRWARDHVGCPRQATTRVSQPATRKPRTGRQDLGRHLAGSCLPQMLPQEGC